MTRNAENRLKANLARLGLGLLGLAAVVLGAPPPSAAAHPTLAPVDLLCAGDCSDLISASRPDGEPFDFGYGGEVVLDGVDLRVETSGSVYLVAPVDVETSIWVRAGSDIRIDGDVEIRAGGSVTIDLPLPPLAPPTPIVIVPAPPIVIMPPPFPPICACIEIASYADGGVLSATDLWLSANGDLRFEGGQRVMPAVIGVPVSDPHRFEFMIDQDGDVYLDVSRVQLYRLKIFAGGSIVIGDGGSRPVPEPGTALLTGFGLLGLSLRRGSRAVG